MSIFKRAWTYISRTRKKTASLCAMMCVMLLLSLVGIMLRGVCMDASQNLKEVLGGYVRLTYSASNDREESVLDEALAQQIAALDGVADYSGISTYYLSTPDVQLVAGSFAGQPQGQVPRFVGCDKSALHENFIYNSFEVIEGRHIESADRHCAVVSDVFANLNGLTVGDRFEACLDSVITQDENAPEKVYSLEIVGIYTIHEGWEITPMTPERDIAENFIFTDMQTADEVLLAEHGVEKTFYRQGVIFTLNDAERLPEIAQSMQNMDGIDWENFELVVNDKAYQDSAASLQMLEKLSLLLVIITFSLSGILLALVLTLWIRERRHEIGILMSLGISKVSIWKQFLLETAIIALAAMVVAMTLSVPCSRMLSEKAFDAAETMAQSQAEEVRDPMADVMEKLNPTAEAAVDVVQKDDVHLTFAACITIVLCTAGIITISVTLSAVPMFRMKPKEILSGVN